MSDPRHALLELAEQCLVRIGGQGDGGSGVWIAPGTVLTCAHVVPAGMGSAVTVQWGGRPMTGTVAEHTPDTSSPGQIWSFPDLAVVMVADPPDHPCALLAEVDLVSDASLTAFGHSDQLQENLCATAVQGHYRGFETYGAGKLWLFKSNEVRSGMSGGPVVDLTTGAVCALVKTTLGNDTDRGGYLVPVQALRHLARAPRAGLVRDGDRFHRRDRSWSSLRLNLPDRTDAAIGPADAADLFGLLAELPDQDEDHLRAIYADCAPNARPPGVRLDTFRDVAEALLDSGGPRPEDGIVPLLRLVHRLSRTGGQVQHAGLDDWATRFAVRHRRLPDLTAIRTATSGRPTSSVVTVEIAPGSADDDHYRLSVTLGGTNGLGRRIYCDETPRHSLDEVRALMADQLRRALCWLGSQALIEFVVPEELFEVPFEELSPVRKYTNLGRSYRVVLRDLHRQSDPYARDAWLSRWDRLSSGNGEVRWYRCTEDLTEGEFSAELETDARTSVMVLSRRPSSNAHLSGLVRVALNAGVPAVTWRRDTCPEHDQASGGDDCSGSRFAGALHPILRKGSPADLPALVQEIRQGAAARRPDPAAEACRGIVLIWDNPTRAAGPTSPVMEPPPG